MAGWGGLRRRSVRSPRKKHAVQIQSPLGELAKEGEGVDFLSVRSGLKKQRMPQTAQYPTEIPNTKATMMVKSNRIDRRSGVITLSFYRPRLEIVKAGMPEIGGLTVHLNLHRTGQQLL